MRPRPLAVAIALVVLATVVRAGVEHPSIGVCTRKEEFAKRQAALDPIVASLSAEIPEQPIGQEIRWFQAYVRGCRGWLNPQTVLPEMVTR